MAKQRYKVELEQEIWHKTRARAIQQGLTAGAVVEEALKAYLSPAAKAAPVAAAEAPKTIPMAAAITAPVDLKEGDDLPDLDAEMAATSSFGSSRPAPKPTSAPKAPSRLSPHRP